MQKKTGQIILTVMFVVALISTCRATYANKNEQAEIKINITVQEIAELAVIINVEPFAEVHLIDDEADLMDNGGSSPDSSRNPDVPPGARFMVKANAPCTLTASAAKIVQKPRGPYGVATRESDGRQFTYTYGLMSRWEVDPDICLWPDSDGAIQFTIDGEDENGRPCIGLTRVMAMRVVPDADETAHGEMRSPGRRTGDLPRSGIYTGFFNLTVALK